MRALVNQANPARVAFGAGALQQSPAEVPRALRALLQRAFDGAAPQA
jgi:hypothetical protein